MKKLSIFLLIAASSSMILFGCGKKEETTTEPATSEEVNAEDIGLGTETEEAPEVAPEETKDGMVQSPLTNEWIDEALANERPIAVMYPTNKVALPQYGLDNIDVFYEILEEGVEKYSSNGIDLYIMKNDEFTRVSWADGNNECSIICSLKPKEIYRMVDSIF